MAIADAASQLADPLALIRGQDGVHLALEMGSFAKAC